MIKYQTGGVTSIVEWSHASSQGYPSWLAPLDSDPGHTFGHMKSIKC